MKKILLQSSFVLLFLAVLGLTVLVVPIAWHLLEETSFKFVGLFLILIVASNVLSKLAVKFITT